jgi:two-component system CheB/CheR fusion protein
VAKRAPRQRPEIHQQHVWGEHFPIVGIGASAGGLEAIKPLLKRLPADMGMAFVVVQHLHPEHASQLANLLGNLSRMPVIEARDGTAAEPDHVYVIPPDAALTISGGVLRLSAREAAPARHMTIDTFFRSLAADAKNRAIGVVLSGSSSDGALGIRAIKAEGGITFAQDEKSAGFDMMPRAAAATGAVDFVLPPEAIAGELAQIARQPYVRLPEAEAVIPVRERGTEGGTALQRILVLLERKTGVDFSVYRRPIVMRRISRRKAIHRIEKLDDYAKFLLDHPGEVEALYDELLGAPVGFFSEPETFEYLKAVVFPRITAAVEPGAPARIWVPACATGEEAYSVAIAFLEFLREQKLDISLQLFATDVSKRAIEKARAGVYLENIAAEVPPQMLDRYFHEAERGGYQVNQTLRDCCVFAQQNIAKDPPLSNFDLLSCRNLLASLEPAPRKHVISAFHYALKPGGFLVLGASEGSGGFAGLFEPMGQARGVYARRGAGSFKPPESGWTGTATGPRPTGEQPVPQDEIVKEADRMVLSRYAPPGVLVDRNFEAVQFRGDTNAFLRPAPGKASLNLLKMLREGLAMEVRSALEHAKRTHRAAVRKNIAIYQGRGMREVDVEVIPLGPAHQYPYFLVNFRDSTPRPPKPGRALAREGDSPQVAQLKRELTRTREYLQSLVEDREAANEQLRTASEGILSNNEELQTINEELETSKEEMQSANEELLTLNEELANRNAQLTKLNDDLSNLFTNIHAGIVMVDGDLRLRRFTPVAGRLLNLLPADIGRPITDLNPGIEVEDLGGLIHGVMDSMMPLEREVADRQGRWHSMSIRPYRSSDNRIEGAVLSLVDIDAIKRSLDEVRRARDFSQTVIDAVLEPLIVLDQDLQITMANPAAERVLHVPAEAAQGRYIEELAGIAGLAELLRSMPPEGFRDREIDAPDNGTFLATARPVRPGGSDGTILLFLNDITERKRAEEQVKLSETLYRELFEQSFNSTTEGILLLDANTGEITGINPFLAELLGVQAEQVTGKRLWDVRPLRAIADSEEKFFERRANLRFEELAIETGENRTVPATIAASLYQAGRRNIVQLNFRDMSARRMLEEQLRQAQKMEAVGRLAGGVAHDFNNLLTVITGNTEILMEQIDPGDPLLEQAEEIAKAANRAAALTRRLLTFSRHDVVRAHPLDLNAVVESMREMLDRLVGERIAMDWQPAQDLRTITADESQLGQVILNLVINAREAMPNGGSMKIRTANVELDEEFTRNRIGVTPGPYVMLEIADTGVGITDEVKQHIFEPFFTTKPVGKGTGLGLATVYAVAKQSGGDVIVESEPGKGTTMRVYFPAAEQAAELIENRPKPAGPLTGTETILLAEDDAGVRRLVAEILGGLGYKVLEAGDGPEALELSRSQPVDLLVTDLVMPKMNGQELARQLREEQPHVRAVFISGYAPDEAGQVPPGDVFLPKPFSRDELAGKIRELLDKGQSWRHSD